MVDQNLCKSDLEQKFDIFLDADIYFFSSMPLEDYLIMLATL